MNTIRILTIGLLILALTGCKDRVEPETAEMNRPVISRAETLKLALENVSLFHEATATVTAETESMIATRIMGPVAVIAVREGDQVKAGQLLIDIDSEDINNKVSGAEAAHREAIQALNAAKQNMILAETTYARFKNLYDEKALSLQELDKIETQKKVAAIEYGRIEEMVKQAEAGLDEAKVYLGYKKIVSPIDGIVTKRFIDPGTMAMPGMPLLTIEDTSRYRLEAEIDESFAGQVIHGTDVDVKINALGISLNGKVSKTVKAVDPRSRTFKVYITLPAETNLRSGLYARIKIAVGEKEIISVPGKAVVSKGQLTGVYVVNENKIISYRLVRLGKEYGEKIEILSGLKPDDIIITDNASRIVDGSILQLEK